MLDERNDVLKVARSPFHDSDTRFVYVVRDDEAVRVPVEFGAAAIGEIEVRSGLAAGDVVVLSDMRDFNDAPQRPHRQLRRLNRKDRHAFDDTTSAKSSAPT